MKTDNRTGRLCSRLILPTLLLAACGDSQLLLEDGFEELRPGMFSAGVIGAHTEYHYLPPAAPQGRWSVSCFRTDGSQRAWRVLREDGQAVMYQSYLTSESERQSSHPILVAGDDLWENYTLYARFVPDSDEAQSGVLFRYKNDRNYYFFGVARKRVELKRVRHGAAYRTLAEAILAQADFDWQPGQELSVTVSLSGPRIRAELNDLVQLEAEDNAFLQGRIGLLADVPTRFKEVSVAARSADARAFRVARSRREDELAKLQAANPKPLVWKRLATPGFGVGRNLRFGDLNRDGRPDLLIGQVVHHGPKDQNSELSCLTAMTLEGEVLWQIGRPDAWKDHLTNDVAFQVHDINGDGLNEVVYCMNQEIVVAEGSTGKTIYKSPTPQNPSRPPHDLFPRILGDSLFFCDVRGTGSDRDIVIKDRYEYFWVLDDQLKVQWQGHCKTGHYPFASDVDGDGRDEIAIGYSLYDDDGTLLFSLDAEIQDHADGVAIVDFDLEGPSGPWILNAASDEGMLFYDLKGRILRHLQLGHVQNPAVANFRDDLPGLETVSINFWGNQGIIHYFSSDGSPYYDFEPVQHGSMMLPVNWTGLSEEYYVLSASAVEGGLFDGWGRKVVQFPADGHPEMCNAVFDITGDCRDEIVVWDPYEVWVYTQDDNPKSGKLYRPVRNPLYNYSNYQATVSLPGWSE